MESLMFKKLLITTFIFFTSLQAYELPNRFFVNQHWFSWTNTFSIKTKKEELGTVHRAAWSWTVCYDFFDTYEELQANAKMRFFSLGAIFDVCDAYGNALGKVDECLVTFLQKFEIFDANDTLLANAKLNFWGTTYTFYDQADDHVIATMHRDFFRFKDDWEVTIQDHDAFGKNKIDPKLMIVLAAFQSDLDFWAHEWHTQYGNTSSAALISEKPSLQMEWDLYDDITPTDEDYLFVIGYVDTLLAPLADAKMIFSNDKEKFEYSLSLLLPLLEEETFTLPQKSALAHLLKKMKLRLTSNEQVVCDFS